MQRYKVFKMTEQKKTLAYFCKLTGPQGSFQSALLQHGTSYRNQSDHTRSTSKVNLSTCLSLGIGNFFNNSNVKPGSSSSSKLEGRPAYPLKNVCTTSIHRPWFSSIFCQLFLNHLKAYHTRERDVIDIFQLWIQNGNSFALRNAWMLNWIFESTYTTEQTTKSCCHKASKTISLIIITTGPPVLTAAARISQVFASVWKT